MSAQEKRYARSKCLCACNALLRTIDDRSLLGKRRDWKLYLLESGCGEVRNVRRDSRFTHKTARMHVSSEHEKRELWYDIGIRGEAKQGVRECDIGRVASINSWAAQELWTLALIQQHVAWMQFEALEGRAGPVHLLEISCIAVSYTHLTLPTTPYV